MAIDLTKPGPIQFVERPEYQITPMRWAVDITDEHSVTRDVQKMLERYPREIAQRILDWLSDWNKRRPASPT